MEDEDIQGRGRRRGEQRWRLENPRPPRPSSQVPTPNLHLKLSASKAANKKLSLEFGSTPVNNMASFNLFNTQRMLGCLFLSPFNLRRFRHLVSYASPNARHFKPHPYTVITLLSSLHCSSQPSQYLSVPNRAHTCLLNKRKVKQRLSPHFTAANREPGFLAQALAHANLE